MSQRRIVAGGAAVRIDAGHDHLGESIDVKHNQDIDLN
jgi:hypothetical protein